MFGFLMVGALFAKGDVRIEGKACGIHCLALLGAYYGRRSETHDMLCKQLPQDEERSLLDLDEAVKRMGLRSLAVQWDNSNRATLGCPAVLLIKGSTPGEGDHFIVCFGGDRESAIICDFPGTPRVVRRAVLNDMWGGVALYVDAIGGSKLKIVSSYFWYKSWAVIPAVATFLIGIGILMIASRRKRVTKLFGTLALFIVCGCGRGNDSLGGLSCREAAQELKAYDGVGPNGEAGAKAVYTIENNSGRDVEITRVQPSCTCIAIENGGPRILANGGRFDLEAAFPAPLGGLASWGILVFYNSGKSPLVLTAAVRSQEEVPKLENRSPILLSFPSLGDANGRREIEVAAIERGRRSRWVNGVYSNLDGLKFIETGCRTETINGSDLVRRVYKYRVEWATVPKEKEFGGNVIAMLGNKGSIIGTVIGSRE